MVEEKEPGVRPHDALFVAHIHIHFFAFLFPNFLGEGVGGLSSVSPSY